MMGVKWYNLIVKVSNEPPMLYIEYALDSSGLNGPKLISIAPYQIDCWGDKIKEMD